MEYTVTPRLRVAQCGGLGACLGRTSPRGGQLATILAVCFVGQLLIYHGAFQIKPSADDYILAGQIRVGENDGPLTFLTSSPQNDYRPLQWAVFWAVGRWHIENPFSLIHILNFVAFAFYTFVFGLWIRLCRLPMVGALCAVGVLILHPVFAGPLADLDGFSRFVASGWIWLGAYWAFRYAMRPWWAVPLTSVCLLIGLGFMEYAVGLVPLGMLATWFGRRSERPRAVFVLAAALLAVFAGYYLFRLSIIGPDTGRISMNPLTWATNLALLGGAVAFMGDTVQVYLRASSVTLVVAAISMVVMVLTVVGGVWLWWSEEGERTALGHQQPSVGNVFGFLCIGVFVSFIPMIFMQHVSEIYVSGIVFPFALLTGFAMAGWASGPRKYFVGCLAVLIAHLFWGVASIGAKVARLGDTGDRADMQMQELLRWIPSDIRDVRVALVFLEPELPERRRYSVFVGGDDTLILPGASARAAIEWFRPGKGLELFHLILQHKSAADLDSFGMALYWNPAKRTFEPLKLN